MRSRSGSGAAAEAGPVLRHETKSLSHAESAFGGGGISSRSGTASGSASGAGAGAGRARRSSSRTSVELLPSARFNTTSLERPGAGIGRRFCELTACRLRTARSTRRSTARVPSLDTDGLGDWWSISSATCAASMSSVDFRPRSTSTSYGCCLRTLYESRRRTNGTTGAVVTAISKRSSRESGCLVGSSELWLAAGASAGEAHHANASLISGASVKVRPHTAKMEESSATGGDAPTIAP